MQCWLTDPHPFPRDISRFHNTHIRPFNRKNPFLRFHQTLYVNLPLEYESKVTLLAIHGEQIIEVSDLQALLTNGPEPGEADTCQDTWTLAEAVQAIVILANFHALSSLCLGVGTRTTTSVFKIDKYLQMKGRGRLRGSKTGEEGVGLQQQATSSNNSLTLLDLKSSRLTLLDERKKWRLAQKELKRKRSFSEGEVYINIWKLIFDAI